VVEPQAIWDWNNCQARMLLVNEAELPHFEIKKTAKATCKKLQGRHNCGNMLTGFDMWHTMSTTKIHRTSQNNHPQDFCGWFADG
jgi:hypothetical protein